MYQEVLMIHRPGNRLLLTAIWGFIGLSGYISEPPSVEKSITPPKVDPMAKPQFVEDFSASEPKTPIPGENYIETTVACNPTRRNPITVKLVTCKQIDGKTRWFFHAENTSDSAWTGKIRIFLLSNGQDIYSEDFETSKPLEPSAAVAPGFGTPCQVETPSAPATLGGSIDQYGYSISQ
jgi:hypothetical protein